MGQTLYPTWKCKDDGEESALLPKATIAGQLSGAYFQQLIFTFQVCVTSYDDLASSTGTSPFSQQFTLPKLTFSVQDLWAVCHCQIQCLPPDLLH